MYRFLSLVLSLICAGNICSQQPQQFRGSQISADIWGVLEKPQSIRPHAGLIILPGSGGWRPAYAELAKVFADSGFITLALDYYAETGRDTSRADALSKWPAWQATVRNAVSYLHDSIHVPPHSLGLIGFSRGAFLAVSIASSLSEVGAVVDCYGGGGGGSDSLNKQVRGFPPLLILHGEADTIVPVTNAYRLRDAVLAAGGEAEMKIYPGAQHGFNAASTPGYSESAATDSWKRILEFLRRRLQKPEVKK